MSSNALLMGFCRVPEFQPPQAGGVDDSSALRPDEQLAMRCRVTATTIVAADFLCCLRVATEQLVGQCRFADARRADKRDGAIAREILFENRMLS